MSDDPQPSTSASGASANVPRTSDSALDITSEHFDPLRALYASNIIVPVRNAPLFDNVSKYESAVTADEKRKSNPSTSAKSGTTATSENPFKRKFLPHQCKTFTHM